MGGANKEIDVVKRGFEAGKGFAGGRQAGGIVPGPINEPRMILAHGGEEVVPFGKRGGGGQGIVFNVNVGVYAGTETEKRNLASDLYNSLVQIAHAQNKSVAEMMGA